MFSPIPQLICTVIERELEAAVENDALRLHYQPQVHLVTHRVVGHEALLRWQHPVRGLLMPGSFLPLVHGSKVMLTIAGWTLHAALRDWVERADGSSSPPVAVNISASLVDDPTCIKLVKTALDVHGAPPEALKLEITEQSLLMRPKRAMDVLKRLHRWGVGISVDDFGTGFSSLVHLRDLPITEVKIDRSFVEALAGSRRTQKIVQTVVTLGSHLGIDVIGEGVASPELEKYLLGTGCELGQGYYLGYPSPITAMNPLSAAL
ncbi:MAG TPA: EAL domain-containing protein [Thermoanaerobaculia bacterium]|nr:EAL domain-containing protein [Thermoanaerobaculia bacterium]